MVALVEQARSQALMKHGSLRGGMGRWEHHLMEECREACDEMEKLHHQHLKAYRYDLDPTTKQHLIEELAQVAQLSTGMIMLLLEDRQFEEEYTWQER